MSIKTVTYRSSQSYKLQHRCRTCLLVAVYAPYDSNAVISSTLDVLNPVVSPQNHSGDVPQWFSDNYWFKEPQLVYKQLSWKTQKGRIVGFKHFQKMQVSPTYYAHVWCCNFLTVWPILKMLGALNAPWAPRSNAPKIFKICPTVKKLQPEHWGVAV